jgi:hypothetical protein
MQQNQQVKNGTDIFVYLYILIARIGREKKCHEIVPVIIV